MAIILKRGAANKARAWFCKCDTCESELKIIQGDPCATDEVCYNCDANQYYVRYICPVCGAMNVAHTSSSFGIEANAEYKEIILTKEDREEMNSWRQSEYRNKFNKEDRDWINNRCRV